MTRKICRCTTETCGCCEGIQILTPQPTENRPGLSALNYRVGTHGAFLETMKARLSTMIVNAAGADGFTIETFTPLLGLTTRDTGDFSIALLDGWATVADVLAYYQERIANEGYLRTATERRSILELARLVGYKLRPGVAATVYLAYTVDEDHSVTPPKPVTTTIPIGSRSQSVPAQEELPQSFETSDPLEARSTWNALQPRITRPQTQDSIQESGLFLKGITTNLKPNDPLLIDFAEAGKAPTPFRVQEVIPDGANDRTQVVLQSWTPEQSESPKFSSVVAEDGFDRILRSLEVQRSIPPPNALQLARSPKSIFTEKADVFPRLLTTIRPRLAESLYPALQNAAVTPPQTIQVYALHVTASLFGATAPRQVLQTTPSVLTREWPIVELPIILELRDRAAAAPEEEDDDESGRTKHEEPGVLWLDAGYDKIQPNSWLIVETEKTNLTEANVLVAQAQNANAALSRSDYGISAKSTKISLADNATWITADLDQINPSLDNVPADKADFQAIRRTAVYAQSEELALAEVPVKDAVSGTEIELNYLYDGLEAGRWLIIAGERDDPDLSGTSGVRATELLMLQGADNRYDPDLPGDKTHTFLRLAKQMAYSYKRDTAAIYGNVVKATHGETRNETLGNGDGGQSLQTFTLKQPPLTFVPAPNPTGVDSTLEVFVNNVQWHETDTLAGLGPKDRNFITKTDNDSKTSVTFGNGKQGARLPTGVANMTSIYRNGIGKPGNVKAEQISLLQTRPLGVKSVINPLSASGGADKENRDQARENAPLAVMSLDRLVSVQDYADFTRTFAGIGKAASEKLSDSKRQLVLLTIAGADDIPIDETSDLYQNLVIALRKFGDPVLPVQVELRELVVLVLSVKVRLAADYQWEPVATEIRAALLDTFGFQKRALGQPVLLSEVISSIQNIDGVAYVDVDAFGGIPEKKAADGTRESLTPGEIAAKVKEIIERSSPAQRVDVNLADFESGSLRPAQLAILTNAVPDTLILNQIK
jgi:predicted phage baseplate assembly protein